MSIPTLPYCGCAHSLCRFIRELSCPNNVQSLVHGSLLSVGDVVILRFMHMERDLRAQ